ncbi:hypothetical protein [Commensalibacter communis]|nr:hypothetical protein [Commensalibacter communis]
MTRLELKRLPSRFHKKKLIGEYDQRLPASNEDKTIPRNQTITTIL